MLVDMTNGMSCRNHTSFRRKLGRNLYKITLFCSCKLSYSSDPRQRNDVLCMPSPTFRSDEMSLVHTPSPFATLAAAEACLDGKANVSTSAAVAIRSEDQSQSLSFVGDMMVRCRR